MIGYHLFTKDDVLKAIEEFPGRLNRSVYINNRIWRNLTSQQRIDTPYQSVSARARRLLENLAESGLVEKLPDNGDGLGYEWNLTELGRAWR